MRVYFIVAGFKTHVGVRFYLTPQEHLAYSLDKTSFPFSSRFVYLCIQIYLEIYNDICRKCSQTEGLRDQERNKRQQDELVERRGQRSRGDVEAELAVTACLINLSF